MNNIKKWSLFLSLLVNSTISQSTISRSVFIARPVSTDSVFELELTNYHRYHGQPNSVLQLYAKPIFIQSHNDEELAQHFLPNNKSCATIDEAGNGDINPLWFNLIADKNDFYKSTICLNPRRTVMGSILTAYLFLSHNLWIGFNTALMTASSGPRLKEKNPTASGILENFKTAYQALSNAVWNNGKIEGQNRSKTGFDDIQYKIGYDLYNIGGHRDTIYFVGTIPTGNMQKSEFLFEPIVGSNNTSLGFGLNGDHAMLLFPGMGASVMWDLKYRYVFPADQMRSFDLNRNGDWSRYLLMVTKEDPLNSQPGINLTTHKVKVAPGSTIDFWLATHYSLAGLEVELGYDFFWRQSENVARPIAEASHGIQTLSTHNQTSAQGATINQGAQGENATRSDKSFTTVQSNDFNRDSATHPQSLSHTVYGSLGCSFNYDLWSLLLGIGTAYEFSHKNALQQWSVWLTTGLSF